MILPTITMMFKCSTKSSHLAPLHPLKHLWKGAVPEFRPRFALCRLQTSWMAANFSDSAWQRKPGTLGRTWWRWKPFHWHYNYKKTQKLLSKTNMTIKNHHLKMYLLLKTWWFFQPAIVVFRGMAEATELQWNGPRLCWWKGKKRCLVWKKVFFLFTRRFLEFLDVFFVFFSSWSNQDVFV